MGRPSSHRFPRLCSGKKTRPPSSSLPSPVQPTNPQTASLLRPIFHGRAARKTENPFPITFLYFLLLPPAHRSRPAPVLPLRPAVHRRGPGLVLPAQGGERGGGGQGGAALRVQKGERETARVLAIFILCFFDTFSVQIPGLPFRDLRGQGRWRRRRRRGEGGEAQMRARYAMYKKVWMLTTSGFYPLFFAAVLFAKEALPAPRNILLSTWVTVMASSYFPPKEGGEENILYPVQGRSCRYSSGYVGREERCLLPKKMLNFRGFFL